MGGWGFGFVRGGFVVLWGFCGGCGWGLVLVVGFGCGGLFCMWGFDGWGGYWCLFGLWFSVFGFLVGGGLVVVVFLVFFVL